MLENKIKAGVGIDVEPAMINLAKRKSKNLKRIEFRVMNANRLRFPKGMFDVIIARHSPLSFKEAHKILAQRGTLITQQVYETDKLNLKKAFKRGQGYQIKAGNLLRKYIAQAKRAGFKIVRTSISNRPYFFRNEAALVDHLKSTPVIPNFGTKKDYEILMNFIKKNKTAKGIKSNTSRFLLELSK